MTSPMTPENVRARVRIESDGKFTTVNDHRMTLKDVLVTPQAICVISRHVENGCSYDESLNVWLVGKEDRPDGYRIVLNEEGTRFGLVSSEFLTISCRFCLDGMVTC